MKRIEALNARWKGYKERRARQPFIPVETPKRSEMWGKVFDAHHPQEPLIKVITES